MKKLIILLALLASTLLFSQNKKKINTKPTIKINTSKINISPIDIINPIDPIDPVDPIDPIDPIDPVDPVDPVDPIAPSISLFHNTQGKFEVSSNGQSTYTLPIALPPSIQNVGPTINLVYVSGQMGGIVGQGWNISTISTISRISTRIDIDGYVDGVDFDTNDMLALDGQRLIQTSGNYWADGSTYQTEVLSNVKIELKGSGSTLHFIVTAPDGSRSWYGNYGDSNAVDVTSFYITRYEDTNGNFITYHYTKPYNKSLCISEIKFSANTNGLLTPINTIKFNYKLAKRTESGYIKGIKIEKVELLDNVEVKTNNLLFKKYEIKHIIDAQLGYERVSQIQEFNAANEPANPVVFDYQTTISQAIGSEIQTTYSNNLDFSAINLSGDFDGDGALDFVTNNKLYYKLFNNSVGNEINLPFSLINTTNYPHYNHFAQTILSVTRTKNNKLLQNESIVYVKESQSSIALKYYNYRHDYNLFGTVEDSNLPFENFGTYVFTASSCQGSISTYAKKGNKYFTGDFNGDGKTEILLFTLKNEKTEVVRANPYTNCWYKEPYGDYYHCFVVEDAESNNFGFVGGTNPIKYVNNSQLLDAKYYYVSDFNGDGRSDVLAIKSNNSYIVASIKKGISYEIEILGEGALPDYSSSKQLLFGDYNGDNKIDLMLPDSQGGQGHTLWHIYYSNPNPAGGDFFIKESHNIVEYWPSSGNYYNTQTHFNNYYALDVNNDGKSDMVRVWRKHYKPIWTINDHNTQWVVETYVNNIGNTQVTGNKFVYDYHSPCYGGNCDHDNDSPDIPIPVVANYKYGGINNQMVMVRNHHNELTYIKFTKDVAKDIRITKVTSSGGNIIDEIHYDSMVPVLDYSWGLILNQFYSSTEQNYPFVQIKRLPTNYLVSKITNTVDGVSKNQDFKYYGLTANLHGLGIIGFEKSARSAWYQNQVSKRIWNVSEYDQNFRGSLKRSYSELLDNGNTFSFQHSGNNPLGIINSTINVYQSSTTNNIYKLSLTSQTSKDFLTNVSIQTSYLYDPIYLLPTIVTTKNFTTDINNPTGTKVTTTDFGNNPLGLGNTYYIGRPLETSTITTAYGDTFLTKEIFTYTNNKVSKIQKRGNTTASKFLVEEFLYNDYGNVIKRTSSSSGYNAPQAFAPRITEFTYDTTQRFVETTKDIEGLISTNVSFHPIYGVVTESKNPFGLSNKTFIDNWGKVTKVTDYLGKSVDISYSKTNGEYVTTKIGEDGSNVIDINDVLARQKKSGSKNIDGTWSYSTIEYDYLGRKFRQSEPYSIGNPTQWNTNFYDDYGRLIKTTSSSGLITNITHNELTVTATDGTITKSSTKNANEHVIAATDNGGTINFKYFADGNLKESDYNGTVIKMEYDEWGRKEKLDDPSAGVYTYAYNALGESITETTPNGTTTFTNDDFGKLLERKVVGVNTNSKATYTYDATTKLLTSLRFDDYNGGFYDEYSYAYDAYKRLFATLENKFGIFYQRVTLYDSFGRPEQEAYKIIAGDKQSVKWVTNSYKNGHRWQIKDNETNQVLWQTNAVNARGQLTNASLGNTIDITNTYDVYGYPTQFKHDKTGITTSNIMTLNTAFEPQRGNLTTRFNSLLYWTENFQYDNQDRLTHYTNAKGVQVQQIYEDDGRIKDNNLGKYNYSNSSKKYQNTSLDVNPESKAYYENRLGLFNDSMEQKIGWTVYWDPTALSYDSTVSRSGAVSLKMNNTTSSEKIAFCENWSKIDNAVPTQYTYSAWVKSNGSNPQAEMFLYMKTANETNSYTQFDHVQSTTTNGWTYIEKTFLVPANIKKIQVRLDNNSIGVLWYDDVRIRKTSDVQPNERQLNISYNTFKSPYQIEETGVDKISFTYNYMNNRSSMYYGGLDINKFQRQYHKHYSADGSMEVKINTKTNEVEFITYIGGDAYSAPIVLKSDGTTQNYLYLHRDYLGSIVAITNATGTVIEKRLFDAWGEILKIQDGQGNYLSAFAVLDRGYTGHEHLQSVGLIHMNGRLYDPKLHRFLQPDNFIQDPYNTQNYNRYGYVLNNPLKHTDPSGEELISLTAVIISAAIAAASYTMTALLADVPFTPGGFVQATFMGALSGVISAGISQGLTTICGFKTTAIGFWQGAYQGAVVGFGSGVINSVMFNNGSLSVATMLKNGFTGALIGGVIGGINGGLNAREGDSGFWRGRINVDLEKETGACYNFTSYKNGITGKYVGKFEGVNIYESSELGHGSGSGGLTLPPKRIIIGKGTFKLLSSNDYVKDLLHHEFGHVLQYKKWYVGSKFYTVIAPESLISAGLDGKVISPFENWNLHRHSHYWTETWANYLSTEYFVGNGQRLFNDQTHFLPKDIGFFNRLKFF